MSAVQPLFIENLQMMAEKMEFISFDSLQMQGREIKSHWYRYGDIDFYYFEDRHYQPSVIKFYLSIFGQVIEWTPFDGLRTGVVVQSERSEGVTETVQFDRELNRAAVEQFHLFFEHLQCLDPQFKNNLQLAMCAAPPTFSRRLKNLWLSFLSLVSFRY